MTAPADVVLDKPGGGGRDWTRHLTSLSSEALRWLSTGPATASAPTSRRATRGGRIGVRAARSTGARPRARRREGPARPEGEGGLQGTIVRGATDLAPGSRAGRPRPDRGAT